MDTRQLYRIIEIEVKASRIDCLRGDAIVRTERRDHWHCYGLIEIEMKDNRIDGLRGDAIDKKGVPGDLPNDVVTSKGWIIETNQVSRQNAHSIEIIAGCDESIGSSNDITIIGIPILSAI